MTSPDPRLRPEDYLAVVSRESQRFAAALARTEGTEPVPTCPGWDADDLGFHLAKVQLFWAEVVARRITDEAGVAPLRGDGPGVPSRPEDHAELLDFVAVCTDRLAAALRDVEPDTHVWTWSTDQTAGFVLRRQAHEALVHRIDAELTAGLTGGERLPVSPELAWDGVHELLTVMYAGCPPWGSHTLDPERALRIRAGDVGQSLLVVPARFTGVDPDGVSYDEDDIAVVTDDGRTVGALIEGAAFDLDCWLWHRPPVGPVHRGADDEEGQAVLETVTRVLERPIS